VAGGAAETRGRGRRVQAVSGTSLGDVGARSAPFYGAATERLVTSQQSVVFTGGLCWLTRAVGAGWQRRSASPPQARTAAPRRQRRRRQRQCGSGGSSSRERNTINGFRCSL
jgi:hypothetical protein